MTGQRRPPGYGRVRTEPLQLAVPSRLPGGVWGQTPLTGTFQYDSNGFPFDPNTGGPSAQVVYDLRNGSQNLSQTEWPIPTRWEIQIGLTITCIAGGAGPWPGATGTLNLQGTIETAIESASAVQAIQLVNGPGVYPFVAALAGVLGLGPTFPVIAQQVRVRFDRLTLLADPALSGPATTWSWSVSTMIGLTAPAIM